MSTLGALIYGNLSLLSGFDPTVSGSGDFTAARNVYALGTADATSTGSGTVQVSGGLSVVKNAYIGNTISANTAVFTNLSVTNITSAALSAPSGVFSSGFTSNAASLISGNLTITNGNLLATGATITNLYCSNFTTSALAAPSAVFSAGFTSNASSVVSGTLTVTNETVTSNLVVQGGLTATNAFISSATIPGLATTNLTIVNLTETSLLGTSASLMSLTTGTMFNSSGATFAGAINVTNATASTSTGTGALVVAGGVGIAGALNLGGKVTSQIDIPSTITILDNDTSTGSTFAGVSSYGSFIAIVTAGSSTGATATFCGSASAGYAGSVFRLTSAHAATNETLNMTWSAGTLPTLLHQVAKSGATGNPITYNTVMPIKKIPNPDPTPTKGKRKSTKKEHKRPASAYIIFCNVARPKMKEQNPDASTRELVCLLAQAWNKLSDKEKEPYKQIAKDRQDEYKRMVVASNTPASRPLTEEEADELLDIMN
ncbi:hypothetical protein SmJEL517_g06131 [Synchytrium microbalum]|uniref:HMG box domain-containing protein n=1 Tax=Synchytrium microbalum TaxID=1806994 RepID=A0A507BK65_9FUNG|nr:uncharacterized protein SmJEL517_g06131 [Synchytrium microbalum]TPX30277.1 hypothetical protein SmJEL517_g06131 [Synchytrium microbalum]